MKCSKCCGSASVSVCTLHLHVVCHEEESSLSSSLLCVRVCVCTPPPPQLTHVAHVPFITAATQQSSAPVLNRTTLHAFVLLFYKPFMLDINFPVLQRTSSVAHLKVNEEDFSEQFSEAVRWVLLAEEVPELTSDAFYYCQDDETIVVNAERVNSTSLPITLNGTNNFYSPRFNGDARYVFQYWTAPDDALNNSQLPDKMLLLI